MSNFKISDLHTYIVKVAEKELNKSSFLDTVTTGTITASHPGYYQVSLTNSGDVSSVNALPMNDATYAINDYVYLLKAPAKGGDNFNNSYFIFGKVSETKETYANLTDWERFNGNLTTVKIDGGNIVTDSKYLEATFDNENLIKDIQESGYFSVSGYFTADESEDFGLIIELRNDIDKVIQTFKLDKNYFTGQVVALTNAYQKRVCSITDESKLVALKKIVVKGFNNGGGNPQVQDIVITAGSMYEAANNLEVKVTTLSGYKDYFRNMTPTEAGQDQIGLKATLYYNNQPLAADNIRYYWCIKDSNATAEDSLPFIEPGWRCLNGYSKVDFLGSEGDTTVQVWKSSSSMIIDEFDGSFKNELGQIVHPGEQKNETGEVIQSGVYKNIFDKTYNNTVACFVKYNGRIFKSDEKNIINYNLHNFKVSLDLNSGNVSDVQKIIYENDTVAAHCTITAEQDGKTLPLPQHAIYTYQWQIKAGDLDITECLKRERYKKVESKTDGTKYFTAVKDEKGNITSYVPYVGTSFEKDVDYYEFESKNLKEFYELNEILNYPNITIKDANTLDTTGLVTESDTLIIELPEFVTIKDILYDIKNATIKVSALISIRVDGADSDAIELQTNEIQIESHTHELEQIHSVFSYKYYLSESMNVTFEKEPREDENGNIIAGSWSGGWNIEDPIETDKNKEDWNEDLPKDEWDADNLKYVQNGWNILNELTPSLILKDSVDISKKYYLYYTKQEDIFKYIGSEQEETPLDSRTWQYPLVLNVFIWNGKWEKMSSVSVDQINTFNQFTQGGKENGIFYQEKSYVLTKDTTMQESKVYYTISFDDKGKPTYTEATFKTFEDGTKEGFAEGVSYYEKTDDKNRLYINATYINTGTLRVGSANNERFFASINEDIVRIAGWNVDDYSLISPNKTVGLNSDSSKHLVDSTPGDSDNTKSGIAFWAGSEIPEAAPFYVTHDGHVHADTIEIGESAALKQLRDEIEAGDKNLQTNIDTTKSELNTAIKEGDSNLQGQIDITNQNLTDNYNALQGSINVNKTWTEGQLKEINTTLSNNLTDAVNSLQGQIDGNITTHFEAGIPFPNEENKEKSNAPAANWIEESTEEKHLGDIYYDSNTEYSYRWTNSEKDGIKTYYWVRISDSDITKAINDAYKAQVTANSKRTIYYRTEEQSLPSSTVEQLLNEGDLCIVGHLTYEYSITNHTKPLDGVTYYTQPSENNYIIFTGDSFEEDINYYIKTLDGTTLTYIYISDNWELIDDSSYLGTNGAYEDIINNINNAGDRYFASNEWTYKKLDENGNEIEVKVPYIGLKALNEQGEGLIYMGTDALVINSESLQLNYDRDSKEYNPGYFKIDTDDFKVIPNGNGSTSTTLYTNSIVVRDKDKGTINDILTSAYNEYAVTDSNIKTKEELKNLTWSENYPTSSYIVEEGGFIWQRYVKEYKGNGKTITENPICLTSPSFRLSSDYQYFKIDKDNKKTPEKITFTVVSPYKNSTGYKWFVNEVEQSGKTEDIFEFLQPNDITDEKVYKIKVQDATNEKITDEIAIEVLSNGVDSYTVILSNESHTVACDANGNEKLGELDSNGKAKCSISVYKGATKLTSGYSCILTPTNCTIGPNNNSTDFYLNTITSDSGSVEIKITIGATEIVKTMNWSKSIDGTNATYGMITSSAGTSFNVNNKETETTTLTAHLYEGGSGTEKELDSSWTWSWYYFVDTLEGKKPTALINENGVEMTGKEITIKTKFLIDREVFFKVTNEDASQVAVLGLGETGQASL